MFYHLVLMAHFTPFLVVVPLCICFSLDDLVIMPSKSDLLYLDSCFQECSYPLPLSEYTCISAQLVKLMSGNSKL